MRRGKKAQTSLVAASFFTSTNEAYVSAAVAVFVLGAAVIFYIYKARIKIDSGNVPERAEPEPLGGNVKAELDAMKRSVDDFGKRLSERRNSLKKIAG